MALNSRIRKQFGTSRGMVGVVMDVDLDLKSKEKELSKAKPVTGVPEPPMEVNENGC